MNLRAAAFQASFSGYLRCASGHLPGILAFWFFSQLCKVVQHHGRRRRPRDSRWTACSDWPSDDLTTVRSGDRNSKLVDIFRAKRAVVNSRPYTDSLKSLQYELRPRLVRGTTSDFKSSFMSRRIVSSCPRTRTTIGVLAGVELPQKEDAKTITKKRDLVPTTPEHTLR